MNVYAIIAMEIWGLTSIPRLLRNPRPVPIFQFFRLHQSPRRSSPVSSINHVELTCQSDFLGSTSQACLDRKVSLSLSSI